MRRPCFASPLPMSLATSTGTASGARFLPGVALALGLLLMYGPTAWNASHNLWTSEEYAHGPIIIAVSAWWFWHRRLRFRAAAGEGGGTGAWVLLLAGGAIYAIGRAEQIWLLEIGSSMPMLAGSIAALYGWRAVREIRFAILFLFFAIPLPGAIVDEITAPLKLGVSVTAEELLYLTGYPVAREGVVLSLGQYKLLIADACSGLYSITSLLALTVVYLNAVHTAGRAHNLLLLASSVPIAFAANVLRVMALGLITYYWGDAAGQGYLHGTAGIMTFVTALLLLLATDALLTAHLKKSAGSAALVSPR
jgi:exosortase B